MTLSTANSSVKFSSHKAALISSNNSRLLDLEQKANSALELRVAEQSPHYTHKEIEEIIALDRRLFSFGKDLPLELYRRFDVLCRLASINLPRPDFIKSHRRLVGPLIVSAKKIFWRLTSHILKPVTDSVREFCSWIVVEHAATVTELRRLSEIVEKLEQNSNSVSS